ncbi:hypothetical protein ABZ912_54695 [Nonomuraea angiospora]|uniref:hypothetical protein n=1 Tax=Nonomuraea angiospora TaxID=46172 RepID=UPI00340BD171
MLLAFLRAHKKLQAAELLRAGDRWTNHDLVFTTKLGGPIERTEDWKQAGGRMDAALWGSP